MRKSPPSVVFMAADATIWLDPEISGEQAAELARSVALGPDSFAWFTVDKAVNNVRNQGAGLAQQIMERQECSGEAARTNT